MCISVRCEMKVVLLQYLSNKNAENLSDTTHFISSLIHIHMIREATMATHDTR